MLPPYKILGTGKQFKFLRVWVFCGLLTVSFGIRARLIKKIVINEYCRAKLGRRHLIGEHNRILHEIEVECKCDCGRKRR